MDLQTASVAEAHPAETQWPEEELLLMRQAKPQIPPLFRKRRKFIAVLGSIQIHNLTEKDWYPLGAG
jgi:hypothetical protein